MRRLWITLPFCLVLAPWLGENLPERKAQPSTGDTLSVVRAQEATLPYSPLTPEQADELAQRDPVAFLKHCLRQYEHTVQGYTCVMTKQERVGTLLLPPEKIRVAFREQPYSVHFRWLEGAGRAERVLYVEGEHSGKMLVRVNRFLTEVRRDPLGSEGKASSRYPITEFGMKHGMLHTLTSWSAAQRLGELHVQYVGRQKIAWLDDRSCLVFKRTRQGVPDDEGIIDSVFYIDADTGLQIGSELVGEQGRLVGKYAFREIQLNPEFAPEQFTTKSLK